MPDSLIRPLTLGDKLRHIADIADRDPSGVKWRLLYVLDELDAKPSPGFVDGLLDRPINLEDSHVV
jgi:hypothetical protein